MNNRSSFWKAFLLFSAVVMLLAWFNLSLSAGHAQALAGDGWLQAAATPTPTGAPLPTAVPASPTPEGTNPHASGDCFACHAQPGMTGKLQNGETISLYINSSQYHDTIHTSCVFCHVAQASYPHQTSPTQSCAICHWQASGATTAPDVFNFDLPYQDARAIPLEINGACQRCHAEKFDEIANSVHTRTMSKDNRFSPVCVDCHGTHNIQPIDRQVAAKLCSKCHLAEYIAYDSSVHGTALRTGNNQDVPVCDSCHGAHNVIGPRDANFRLDAFEMCGKCHADKNRMAKYNISTDVLSTYLDDFHGRSADLFGQPGATKITMAACYDCHGVHNILPPDDPNSKVAPANLQRTCQECHPDASATFPQAWLGHKRLSLTDTPGLYLTNILLLVSVVVITGLFIIYIVFDVRRRLTGKKAAGGSSSKTEPGK
jgi:hypothetical protein